ncbi:MAG: type III pantothenate kinase, partial [Alphaproteobacteria bacterium]|nr:type III pantothenate kinase [Alphaproteobacteria bacterium]
GTATTFDVVGARGDYLGGPIAPGINLSLEALYMAAAKLPGIAVKRPPKVIGTNTVHAMQSGVYWGYVGLIEGLVGRIEAEYRQAHPEDAGKTFKVIGTGGLAPLFGEATRAIHHLDGDLTMRGLHLIWQRNGGR